MGIKHPDKIAADRWRESFETVAQMRIGRWRVVRACDVCGVRLKTPLGALERLKGPGFSLWNREPACLVEGCTGHAHYEALPPRCSLFFRLRAPER
jgi:hypothetical protein